MGDLKCGICENTKNNHLTNVREMMFGTREIFEYFECSFCGCLQIVTIPENMDSYYSTGYHSFNSPIPNGFFKKKRNRYAVLNDSFIGKIINLYRKNIPLQSLSEIKKLDFSHAILDVGTGNGIMLNSLSEMGFTNLFGVDPFIDKTIVTEKYKIYKNFFTEIDMKFDVIMFHHSFEHMPNPFEVFQHINKILKNDGTCIIRIPTVSSLAWKKYKENWVQIDAPRHFFINSLQSMQILAESAKLNIEKVLYDSFALQFWGSEQYKKDIPLISPQSYAIRPSNSIFSRLEIKSYKKQAKLVNKEKQGDQAAFYLKKSL